MKSLSATHQCICAAALVVIAGFVLEQGARRWLYRHPQPIEKKMVMGIGDTRWFEILEEDLATPDNAEHLYRPDSGRFWKLHPDRNLDVENVVYRMHGEPLRWQLKTNAAGHRGAPYPPTTTAPVIVALGDSSTFGFRVNDNETYSAQLQTNLRTHGLAGATVVNYGIPGYTSFQGRRLLTEILTQHDPDFVLLSFGANDQKTDILSDADKAERISTAQLEYSDYFGLPATVRLFREPPTFERRKPTDPTAPPLRVSPEEFRVNMQAMIHFAQRRGAQVILLDLILAEPVLGEVIHELALENQLPRIDGRTLLRDELLKLLEGRRHQAQRVARQQFWKDELDRYRPIYYSPSFFNDLFADPVWNGLLLFFLVDPLHPNALGHQVIAEALAPLIDPSRSETVTEPESATHP